MYLCVPSAETWIDASMMNDAARPYCAIALAVLSSRPGALPVQEEQEDEHRHRQPAPPAEEEAEAEERGALVVVVGQFGDERGARDLVERDEGPDHDRDDDEVGEQLRLREPGRRRSTGSSTRPRPDRRGVHQRMAAPPARVQVVREVADHRVGERVDDQRDDDAERRPTSPAGRAPGCSRAAGDSRSRCP